MKHSRLIVALLGIVVLTLATVIPVFADIPQGDVFLYTAYPSVVAEKGKRLTFPIQVKNQTEEWQEVELHVQGPDDWEVELEDRGFLIRKVLLEPEKSRTIDLRARPPENAQPGEYVFIVSARGNNGQLISELKLTVALKEKEEKETKGLTLSTKFPKLRGQAGNTFSFKLDLKNNADEDRDVSLSAEAPRGWEVIFKPAFEAKQVSSIRMKSGASQGIDVEITPPGRVEAGEYQVVVIATADGDRAEVPLSITIVGKRRIGLTTLSGQLNTRATIGKETTLDLVVVNTGSAPLRNIQFSSSEPSGWEVTFEPEQIDELAVDQEMEVKAIIKPSPKALAGDYMLTLRAFTPETSDSKDIRVTVETPTTWGWIAVAAIVLVFGGLGVLFVKLSRR
jgi:uncharacterized membrane protein